MADSPLTVVQYGAGTIGAAIARLVTRRADLRLVGVIDNDPGKIGRDAGEVLGLDSPLGFPVQGDDACLRHLAPTVVMHSTASELTAVVGQIEAAAQAGAQVISTCEELAFPYAANAPTAERLDAVGRAAGVSILGTGVNPGFVMDRLPATLFGVCEEIDEVEIIRVVDTSRRRPQLQAKSGLGLDLETFAERARTGAIRHVGLPESARLVAAALGWNIDRIVDDIEPVVAQTDIETGSGGVAKGAAAGVHQTATCLINGRERIRLDLTMAYGADEPRDEIQIAGTPPVHVVIPDGIFGDAATAGVVVNSARPIGGARNGLITVLDLPLR
jgi:hypothetical protein